MPCEICGDGPCRFPTFCQEVDASYKTPDPAKPANPSLPFLDTSSWDEPPPPQEWTVQDRFPRREVALFSGEGGSGKSTIGLHLCAAHAAGRDWLNALPEPGPSMFVDAEDDEKVIQRRLWNIQRHYGIKAADLAQLKIVSLHGKDATLATAMKNGAIKPTPLYAQLIAAARLFSPQTIVLASLANFYAGSEIDRSQVTQFISLMNHLAIQANGSVILISHPSVTGMTSDSGISGSTQWHNAVRARMYLRSAKANGDDSAHEPNVKQLEFRKNQYGPVASAITLNWRDGLFLPEQGPSSFDRQVRESQANIEIKDMLEKFITTVSPKKTAPNYAPRVFAQMAPAQKLKLSEKELEQAMHRLLQSGAIHIVEDGPPSKRRQRIVFNSQ